ncbi:Gfo/Idh/MocA family protein [Hoeflea prorocentri]|uniref:Gfo/Idh/MocA family oxidoreductase n=1 Tax=Hoeflea prorocentri TaxID=1922333 RepID=A0A9X3UJB7_9HYPH|nr:Gfo/Idh/MocA family oxidoreductase [Hoeflea prorocentri]MCY6381682.1 Gfo/Idh/MocA family oxidoreductase [Hoeflea prorocentri]MDA5399482.1 Gfo/Idh/MocA family oxidoreductase [Hoeflea prorocentri]
MINWAILGTGFISNTVAEAIRQSSGSNLAAVAGRSRERVEAFAAEQGIPKAYFNYDDALADNDIDAVYIGLPNHAHLPMVKLAAAAGKAILSEKSLTTTYEDAEELIACVKAHDTFFVEGLMYLSHPLYPQVERLLGDERLGAIRSVNGFYAANIKDVANPAGGGTLYNLGCYPASLLQFVVQRAFGEEAFSRRRITAVGNRDTDGNICDAAVSARFENGVHATLQSTDSYGMHHGFEVIGENGTLTFRTNPWLPVAGDNILEIKEHGASPERIELPAEHDAFYYQIMMVEDCLKRGAKQADRPSPRWTDSLEIMRFLTDWEQAAKSTVS